MTHNVHWCVTVDYQQIANDNIANQIRGFTIDYGKFILTKDSKRLVHTIFSDMKNKSVKLPFVAKNSKHLVGTGAENLLALIELTPLRKTSVKLPFVTKN